MIAIGVESIDFAAALIRYAEAGGKYLQMWGIDKSNYLDAGNKAAYSADVSHLNFVTMLPKPDQDST